MEAQPDSPPPFAEALKKLLENGTETELRGLLAEADAVEIAAEFAGFSREEQLRTLGAMPAAAAAGVVRELEHASTVALLEAMPVAAAAGVMRELEPSATEALLGVVGLDRLSEITATMEPDDAADLVGMLGRERREALLSGLDPQARAAVSFLLSYPRDTAGGIMDPDVARIRENQTVAEAVAEVRRYVDSVQLDNFFSLFVVTVDGSLVGSVPTWKMLLAQPEQYIREIMDYDLVAVEAHLDQEEVSRLVRKRDLVSVPVVDQNNHLIGRITHDDIVDVIHEELGEDLGHLAGTGSEEIRELSLFQTIRLRFPWLSVALVGEFLLAMFMQEKRAFLAALPELAFFFPLIMAVGGTSGVQSSSLVIRGLATGEVVPAHFWRRMLREFLVALSIGTLFAAVLMVGGAGITGNFPLGVTVGLATMAGVILAATLGAGLPILFKQLNIDPALATGPFVTTLNDILGILIFLGLAYLILT